LAGLLDAVSEGVLWVRLSHFYHVYADGAWEAPVTEHLHALTVSGLLDSLDDLFVGIVGHQRIGRLFVKLSLLWSLRRLMRGGSR